MNSVLLWAVPMLLALALVAWALLRRRPLQGRRRTAPPAARRNVPPQPMQKLQPAAAHGAVAAQHQAATEALRLARRRKAEDEARLAAERATSERASERAAPRPEQPTPALLAARPATPRPLPASEPRPEPVLPVLSPLAIQLNSGRPAAAPAETAPAGLAPLRASSRAVRPPTVLVADDSKVVQVKTSRLLERLGWQVLLADDGQAALRCLEEDAPDLLITDVEMPGLDGFALTRHLRRHPVWARLPVIMITSSDDKHRTEALAAGVNVLLGKPYAEETLIAQAQALLGTTFAGGVPALH